MWSHEALLTSFVVWTMNMKKALKKIKTKHGCPQVHDNNKKLLGVLMWLSFQYHNVMI